MELFSLQDWQYMLLTLPILVMALSFHEYAHAYTANKLEIPHRRNREGLPQTR